MSDAAGPAPAGRRGGPRGPGPGRSRVVDGVRAAASLGVAALAFGVSFGVIARASGMGRLAPVVMSATTFAGSAQFAAASVLGAGGGVAAAVAAAVLLNLRYGPIGLSASPGLTGPPWRRALAAQLVVDESWAISQRGTGRVDGRVLVGAGLVLYVGWVGGTAVGVFAASLAVDPARLGLDAAFPALFLALLVPQLRRPPGRERGGPPPAGVRSRRLAALGGAVVALALIPLTGPGVPIVAASLACAAGLWRP